MSDYIFPFNYVNSFNNLFTDDVLPYSQYSEMIFHLQSMNPCPDRRLDALDQDILNSNVTPCSFIGLDEYANSSYVKNFSLFHLNINSASKHFSELISNFNHATSPSIIALSETKLSADTEDLYYIDGYNSFFNSKSSNSGGLALFIKSVLHPKPYKNGNLQLNHLESICVTVMLGADPVNICLVYRRPSSNVASFLEEYNELQRKINKHKCIIVGDVNLDLLKYEKSGCVRSFVECNSQNSFFPIINLPTRISSHSATLIDQAWSNFLFETSTTGHVIRCDISDHFAIGVHVQNSATADYIPESSPNYRSWIGVEDGSLMRSMESKLHEIDLGQNVSIENSICSLIDIINCSIDETCPLIHRSRTKHISSKLKPWISNDLLNLIKEKNKLFSKYCKKPITFGEQYRTVRNNLNNLLQQAESNYYKNLIQSNISDSKKTWQTLNEILNRSPKNSNANINEIFYDDKTIKNPKEIAEAFNDYFTKAPKKIAESLPTPTVDFRSYMPNINAMPFNFVPITPSIVSSIIASLKSTGGSGVLNIPNKIVKALKDTIDAPLTHIFNRCLMEGYFPDILKIAEVQPLFKAGEKSLPQNFRPISILPCLSKILEKIISLQLTNYFEVNNIVSDCQWGFRRGISTEIAIAKFIQKVALGFNNKEFGIGIFLDLQKAFDLVDSSILISKLEHYGIHGTNLNLLKSFLSNRRQCVSINNIKSSLSNVSLGTPQGSCLSPLLFLIFINDICHSSSILHFNLFADDTSLYLSDPNLENLCRVLNAELAKVGAWITANKLSLNVNKSVYLLFKGKKRIGTLPNLSIFNKPIIRKNETKFLGVIIDDKLSWKPHTNLVAGKLSRAVGILNKIKTKLPISAMRTLYFAIAFCHIRFGIIFWGSVSKDQFKKIFVLQKSIVRLINKATHNAPSDPLFKKTNLLKLNDIKTHEMCKFIHSDIKFGNYFNFHGRSVVHSHNTRNLPQLSLPQPRCNILKNSLFFCGVQAYNNLPDNLKILQTKTGFKNAAKFHFISSYNPSNT